MLYAFRNKNKLMFQQLVGGVGVGGGMGTGVEAVVA